jgi:hypothetical protein
MPHSAPDKKKPALAWKQRFLFCARCGALHNDDS